MRQTKRKQSEIVGRFFIYKAKGPNAQGKYHVKLRYTINRVEAIQGTGVWVLGKDWDDKEQRVKPSDLLAKVYNKKLEDFKLMVDTRIQEFPSDKVLTSKIVRLMMQQDYDPNPENKKERDFLEIVAKELMYEYKKDKLAYSTYYNALQYMETFKTFLSLAIGNNTIEATEITERLIDDYILWRKTDRHNCNETINKSLTPIIKGIRASVGLGLVPDSLYVRVSSKYLSAEKRSLTEEDIEDQVIFVPSRTLGLLQKLLNEILKSIYTPNPYAMGFCEKRSIVTNAQCHIGNNYVYNIDLEDFFGSIQANNVFKRLLLPPFNFSRSLATAITGLCCIKVYPRKQKVDHFISNDTINKMVKYVLPQGASTSPLLSNVVCENLDRRLIGLSKRFNLNYSRYADDITFSSMHNVYQDNSDFILELNRIIEDSGFSINTKKTRLQKKGGRQEVTGLIVCEKTNVSVQFVRSVRQLLYIWKWYGKNDAQRRYKSYSKSKKDTPIDIVLKGKINFIKMVKGENDSTYLRLKEEYDRLINSPNEAVSSTHVKFVRSMTLSQFEGKYGRVGVALGKNGVRYAYWKKLGRYLRFMSIGKNVVEFDAEKLCVSECIVAGGGSFFLLHNKAYRHRTRDEFAKEKKNKEKSLIQKVHHSLAATSPLVIDFSTICNAGKCDFGEYSQDSNFHYFTIADYLYRGNWSDLLPELVKRYKYITFDVCFRKNNQDYIVPGKDISLKLVWPWDPPHAEACCNNLLVIIGIHKGNHPKLDSFVEEYHTQMRDVDFEQEINDYIFEDCMFDTHLDAMADAGMLD